MSHLKWSSLLLPVRVGFGDGPNPPEKHPSSKVSVYQEDISRICFSSAFRRMQGKTQVHAFPRSDYIRTRLTHSIEVRNIGQSIVEFISDRMESDYPNSDFIAKHAIDVVAAACLAHDIGNPPFGHVGEYAIQNWFHEREDVLRKKGDFDDSNCDDFRYIDGNALGFRVLTALQGWKERGGLQLSHATLGAFTKYPWTSNNADPKKKKFGFLRREAVLARNAFRQMGLGIEGSEKSLRHPLSYVMEAADDIAYLITDIEDAVKYKIIKFEEGKSLLKPISAYREHAPRYNSLETDAYSDDDRIAYLRSGAISAMIDDAVDTFFSNYNSIMDGRFSGDLVSSGKLSESAQKIRNCCVQQVYNEPSKCRSEAAACRIVFGLMDSFSSAAFEAVDRKGTPSTIQNERLYQILPHSNKIKVPTNKVDALQYVIDFVCGMTDRYAAELYQQIYGVHLDGFN